MLSEPELRVAEAYRECAEITRRSGSSFASAFWMLPKPKRNALHAIYAFCRLADDIADAPEIAGDRTALLARWRAENVGYVFQQANLVPVLTAYENVELPLWLFPLSRDERHARVSLALSAVGLADRAAHLPRQLSGGQEQRVAIARAIVADPPLLVADEPTGNLDHESAAGVMTLLSRLHAERGKTVVMVTHDPNAARHGSRSMHLDKGRLHDLSTEGVR